MRYRHLSARAILLAVLAVAALPCAVAAQPASMGSGPAPAASVLFPEKAFEFAPVIDGVKVLHDFVVQNKGSGPLLINDVRTG